MGKTRVINKTSELRKGNSEHIELAFSIEENKVVGKKENGDNVEFNNSDSNEKSRLVFSLYDEPNLTSDQTLLVATVSGMETVLMLPESNTLPADNIIRKLRVVNIGEGTVKIAIKENETFSEGFKSIILNNNFTKEVTVGGTNIVIEDNTGNIVMQKSAFMKEGKHTVISTRFLLDSLDIDRVPQQEFNKVDYVNNTGIELNKDVLFWTNENEFQVEVDGILKFEAKIDFQSEDGFASNGGGNQWDCRGRVMHKVWNEHLGVYEKANAVLDGNSYTSNYFFLDGTLYSFCYIIVGKKDRVWFEEKNGITQGEVVSASISAKISV